MFLSSHARLFPPSSFPLLQLRVEGEVRFLLWLTIRDCQLDNIGSCFGSTHTLTFVSSSASPCFSYSGAQVSYSLFLNLPTEGKGVRVVSEPCCLLLSRCLTLGFASMSLLCSLPCFASSPALPSFLHSVLLLCGCPVTPTLLPCPHRTSWCRTTTMQLPFALGTESTCEWQMHQSCVDLCAWLTSGAQCVNLNTTIFGKFNAFESSSGLIY